MDLSFEIGKAAARIAASERYWRDWRLPSSPIVETNMWFPHVIWESGRKDYDDDDEDDDVDADDDGVDDVDADEDVDDLDVDAVDDEEGGGEEKVRFK